MSKYKNINLVPFTKNGQSLFILVGVNGTIDPYFDFFINQLVQRRFRKNTIQTYSYAVASFIDYILENTNILSSQNILFDGEKLTEIISNFPIYLSSGKKSPNPLIKQVAENLSSVTLSSATEELYVAAVNQYLLCSEGYRQRLYQIKKDEAGNKIIPENKLFPWTGTKRKLSNNERFNINAKNVISSVISGGTRFRQMATLKSSRTGEKTFNATDKEFPILKVGEFIKAATSDLDKALISLLAASGIRTSEALLLTFGDINLDKREIFIKNPRNRDPMDFNGYFNYEEQQELPFKTRATENVFLIKPFDDLFWHFLQKYIENERISTNKHTIIFNCKKNDTPLILRENKNFIQRFKHLSKKITGESYSPHALRHMYISYLVNYFPCGNNIFGLPIERVQKLVGHANINNTQKYAHPDVDIHKKQQIAFFDQSINEKSLSFIGEKLLNIENKIKGNLND